MIQKIDNLIIPYFQRYGILFLRISLGIVFFWFGVLKFFPNISPAENLATKTIDVITYGMIPHTVSIKLLALWETIIGIGLFTNRFQRTTLFLLWSQMVGAWLPLVVFPTEMFVIFPVVLTLEGQYIVKNVVLIAASFVLAGHIHSTNKNNEIFDEEVS
jgi:uncharacterized membrane protein YkgB